MITYKRFTEEQLAARQAADNAGEPTDAAGLLKRVATGVEQSIGAHPVLALGAAVSLGVMLGWLTKRR